MIYKYKMGYCREDWTEDEIEGIIFAENFDEALDVLLEIYYNPDLISLHIDFYDENPIFEF